MRAVLAALLILASGRACAQWERTDTAMLTGALTLATIDWGQTRDLVRRQSKACFTVSTQTKTETACFFSPAYREASNPFLPAHPTSAQVDKSFAIGMALTAGMAYVLPQTYRRWFLGGVIIIEAGTVIHNHHIGLNVDF